MDGAASAFAAVSLAIQLADSVKKLSDFWKSVQEAPPDVQCIITDLDLLSTVLCEIASEARHSKPDVTLQNGLCNCQVNVKALCSMLCEFRPGLASSKRSVKRWTAIKTVMKWEQVKKFQRALDSLKSTLMLVLQKQIRYGPLGNQVWSWDLDINVIFATDVLPEENSKAPEDDPPIEEGRCVDTEEGEERVRDEPSISPDHGNRISLKPWNKQILYAHRALREYFCGSAYISSTTKSLQPADDLKYGLAQREESDQFDYDTLVTVRPAAWLRKLGLVHGLQLRLVSSSMHGWTTTLSSFRLVPDDAAIFRYCVDGDLVAVRELLDQGEASAKDTNSAGSTPLHAAAENHHVELCKLLIVAGADRSLQTTSGLTPGQQVLAIHYEYATKEGLGSLIDTVELFLDCTDFSDTSCDGWNLLASLVDATANVNGDSEAQLAFFDWATQQFSWDVKANFIAAEFQDFLRWCAIMSPRKTLHHAVRLGPDGAINGIDQNEWNVLLQIIAYGDTTDLLTCGANPNHLSRNPEIDLRWESPTSAAMYSSGTFWLWRHSLNEANVDTEILLGKEMFEGPLVGLGWTRATLRRLFYWDFAPYPDVVNAGSFETKSFIICQGHHFYCADCHQLLERLDLKPQVLWLQSLNEIKHGKDPQETPWARNTRSRIDVSEDVEIQSDTMVSTVDCSAGSAIFVRPDFTDPKSQESDTELESGVSQGRSSDINEFLQVTDSQNTSKLEQHLTRGDCIAAECKHIYGNNLPGLRVGRASDIWSFGCITASLLIFVSEAGGAKAVEEFTEQRRVKDGNISRFRFYANDAINKGVVERFESLEQRGDRPSATTVLADLRTLSLFVLSEHVQECFINLYRKTENTNLYGEKERFQGWRDALNIADAGSSRLHGARVELSDQDFETLVGHLRACRQLLDNPGWTGSLLPLRHRIGLLLASCPSNLQSEAQDYTERRLLARKGVLYGVDIDFAPADSRMRRLINMKLEAAALDRDAHADEGSTIDPRSITVRGHVCHFQRVEIKSVDKEVTPALVEETYYSISRQSQSSRYDSPDRRNARLQQTVKLLSESKRMEAFHTLPCRGYYVNSVTSRSGLVYGYPKQSQGKGPQQYALTLRQILSDEDLSRRVPLEQRFKLAYALAAALYELHKVGWLHRTTSAGHVIFFFSSNSTGATFESEELDLQNFYWAGFAKSRASRYLTDTDGASEDETHDAYYNHPLYLARKKGFQPSFDYYSLGIVLLEIGVGGCVPQIRDELGMKSSDSLQLEHLNRQRTELVDTLVPRLLRFMGSGYCNAGRACLDDTLVGEPIRSPEEQTVLFKKSVLDLLAAYKGIM
ncbi:MAG: hypothetical protein M1831_005752 [Alyxoria varia]|nr:MAG: hypothetical protein M1831_005752 [Alyxoria varia]